MLNFLTPYKLFIGAGVVLFLLGGLVYAVHHVLERQRELGYNEAVAEYTTKALIAEADARRKERQLTKQLQDAQYAAIIREQEIKHLSVAVDASVKQLRDTTTTLRNKLPTDSVDAVRRTADTALTVSEECTGKYTKMAENADGHAIDVKTLTDAWPK